MNIFDYITLGTIHLNKMLMVRKGIKVDRPILVLESDDWGSMTVPDKKTYEQLKQAGIQMDKTNYSRYDTLESVEDLTRLYEVLDSVKDAKGKPCVMTLNYLMANPDYQTIRDSNYTTYVFESVDKTYNRYGRGDVVAIVKDGMGRGFVLPQLHGREHLNIPVWMRYLQKGLEPIRIAFEHEMFAVVNKTVSVPMESVKRSMYPKNMAELQVNRNQIQEAQTLFENVWGFKSESFIAPNYSWHPLIEDTYRECGIKYLQCGYVQQYYDFDRKKDSRRYHYAGQRLSNGLLCTVRNVEFEPSINVNISHVNNALQQVVDCFKRGYPCIISTHRVNYCGGLDLQNRENSLKQLKELLKRIVEIYPNVEFMSSIDLFRLIEQKKH